MAEKSRRHSVAVMTSQLTAQRHRLPSDSDDQPTTVKSAAAVKATTPAGSKATERAKTPAPDRSVAAPLPRPKVRRHSVFVHPGAAVSVMEAVGGGRAAAADETPVGARPPSLQGPTTTSSNVIDGLIEAADKALLPSAVLPRGSDCLRMAILEVDEELE